MIQAALLLKKDPEGELEEKGGGLTKVVATNVVDTQPLNRDQMHQRPPVQIFWVHGWRFSLKAEIFVENHIL